MRIIIQARNGGGYVWFLKNRRGSEYATYPGTTPDAQDAHDFQSEAAARTWMRENRFAGTIRFLNDDGSWPLED